MKFDIKFSSIVIVVVFVLNVLFTLEVLEIVKAGYNEPSALIAAVFAFTTGELWCLKDIKKAKINKEGERHDS